MIMDSKKIISIFLILIVIMGLALISGCTERESGETGETPETVTTEDDTAETTSPTETPVSSTTENATTNKTVGSISQEDLDKLKEDLEELEYDDLGGLEEE